MVEVRERLWIPQLRQLIKNAKFRFAMNAKVFNQCYAQLHQLEIYLTAVQVIQEGSKSLVSIFWTIKLYNEQKARRKTIHLFVQLQFNKSNILGPCEILKP